MFGLGWGEMVVIGIVALIAIGPKELPTVLRTLGQWMGKVRRMANEFQGQFQEALREAEFADLKKHADDISSSVNDLGNIDPIGDVQKNVEHEFAGIDPAADVKPAETPGTGALAPDGAQLPSGVLPSATEAPLPKIDVPLPAPPAVVTEKDFAPAEPAPTEKSAKKRAKKARSGA
jgi:sec-independent protein translocase protein TatB